MKCRMSIDEPSYLIGVVGKYSFHRKSLHAVGRTPNPYEQAISIIGRTLSPFDEDNLIPCFGFGDGELQFFHQFFWGGLLGLIILDIIGWIIFSFQQQRMITKYSAFTLIIDLAMDLRKHFHDIEKSFHF